MSEFWKSTPKYWCKYCTTYVKDTPLEKTNHEASPRHQGNLKKSLKDLHRNNERAEREKQYAKAEAARLNGTGSAAAPLPGSGDGKFKTTVNFTRTGGKPVTADDRKRQMAELAALGVAVPEDFRRENAMVGDWQTTASKVIWQDKPKKEAGDAEEDGSILANGLRKRKIKEEDDEEDDEEHIALAEDKKRPRYGHSIRSLPGEKDDLDALLGSTTCIIKKSKPEVKTEVKIEQNAGETDITEDVTEQDEEVKDNLKIKKEGSEEDPADTVPTTDMPVVKDEEDNVGSIFKKRKRPLKANP